LLTSFVSSTVGAGDVAHLPAKIVWAKLVRIGQIWLDLSEIWAILRQNLGNIKAKFGKNEGEIWPKVIKFRQNQNLAALRTFGLLYG